MKKLLIFISMMVSAGFTGCSPKTDAEIKEEIQTNLKVVPDASGLTVDVKGGIATIEGQCKDNADKANCEKIIQEVKGVKTVINNLTVGASPAVPDTATSPVAAAPVTSPVPEIVEDPFTKSVREAVKNYPSVEAAVNEGIITLTGSITKSDLPKLTRTLKALKPKKIEQKLTIIKYQSRKIAKAKIHRKGATPKKRRRH